MSGMNGLLGFYVSDAQLATLPGVAVADQDNNGVHIIVDRTTVVSTPAPELGAAAAILKQYEISFRQNAAISEALRILKNSIIASFPESDKNELSDPSFGLVSVSFQRIIDHLRKRHGTFLASDFESFRADLDTKIGSRTFPELAAHHRFLQVQFSSANQGLSEVNKCRYRRAAIGDHIAYTTAITSYLTAHPTIANQAFLGLITHITEQAPNFTLTPIDLEYMASALATPHPSAEYFESAAFAVFVDKRILAALPRQPQARATTRAYCLKHGYNSHTIEKCRFMASTPEYTVAMKTANTHTAVTNSSTQGL